MNDWRLPAIPAEPDVEAGVVGRYTIWEVVVC